eukprot:7377158-Prymnesium_polylepis.1
MVEGLAACAATSAATCTAACTAACTAPAAGFSSSHWLLDGGHRHDIDDDSAEDAGVGSAASQRRQPNGLWWQLESTRMTTSRVPPVEAAATAGLSRAVPSA